MKINNLSAPVHRVYVVRRDFSVALSGVTKQYKLGDLITVPYIIDLLLSNECPISELDTADEVCTCPNCGNKFFL